MKINNIQDIIRPDGIVVFVTGCSGQDGSLMVDYLLRETNASVIGGARRLSVENHTNIKHLENESRFQLVNPLNY
jgi:GDP-D-mannose dehydratase